MTPEWVECGTKRGALAPHAAEPRASSKSRKHAPFGKVPGVVERAHTVGATGRAPVVPVAAMVEGIVGCKWSVRLLGLIADGCERPSALLRACPGLSAKVMNERLAKMTRFGIVHRVVTGTRPPVRVEYTLTTFGRRFVAILDEVRKLQKAVDGGRASDPEALGRHKVAE
ncbi:MAG: winged helix-turn-helix transcriptional regulator [Planctomycetes bacterium]|nr:winged helix-turn-helix transcriptional regulator [Planctomycetota bacterium]